MTTGTGWSRTTEVRSSRHGDGIRTEQEGKMPLERVSTDLDLALTLTLISAAVPSLELGTQARSQHQTNLELNGNLKLTHSDANRCSYILVVELPL